MSNQEKREVLKDQHQTISYKRENSVMKADGDHFSSNLIVTKYQLFKIQQKIKNEKFS